MDKTFDEAISEVRNAERGVEVREALAQGFEYVKQYGEAVIARQEEAVQSAETATNAAATATAQAAAAKVIVSTDTTLTVSGAPADAKATGDALAQRYRKDEADAKFGTPATPDKLGPVKVGAGLGVTSDGTLSVTSVNGFTVKAQTTDPGVGSSLDTGTVLLVYA